MGDPVRQTWRAQPEVGGRKAATISMFLTEQRSKMPYETNLSGSQPMVSPRKENSWARKLAKELRERASEDMRRESAARVHPPTRHVLRETDANVNNSKDVPAKAETVLAKAQRKLRENNSIG